MCYHLSLVFEKFSCIAGVEIIQIILLSVPIIGHRFFATAVMFCNRFSQTTQGSEELCV